MEERDQEVSTPSRDKAKMSLRYKCVNYITQVGSQEAQEKELDGSQDHTKQTGKRYIRQKASRDIRVTFR